MGRVLLTGWLLSLLASVAAHGRIWTNDNGELLEANFVRLRDGVAILNAQGQVIRAPVDRLSEGDQLWIKVHEEGRTVREWKLETGEVHRGRLVETEGGVARLKMGRKEFNLTISDLCKSDQILLRAIENTKASIGPTVEKAGMTSSRRRSEEEPPLDTRATRTWTDVLGRQVEGEVLEIKERSIVLEVKGKEFDLPIHRLADNDQLVARNLAERLKNRQPAPTPRRAVAQAQPRHPPAIRTNRSSQQARRLVTPQQRWQAQPSQPHYTPPMPRIKRPPSLYPSEKDSGSQDRKVRKPVGPFRGGIMIMGLAAAAVGNIWLLLVAAREDILHAIAVFFVPFYALYFVAKYSEKAGAPFSLWLMGIITLVITLYF